MDITHSPYKGLTPYTEEDAEFFFGRDRDCDIITANLFASRLTILFGASGVGKSSVLQAGVAHKLRQKGGMAVVVFNDWHGAPLENLRQAVQDEMKRVLGTSLDQEEAMSLEDFLADCASRIDGQLVIILDQFEEYLLYHPGDKGPGSFVAEFARVVNSRDVPVSFLIAIREDSLAKLDRFKGRIPQLFGNYLRLDHLDEKAAREAIERPLEKVGWEWEADLVEAVIDQVRVGRIGLGEVGRGEIREPSEAEARVRIETPFLQIVMTRLWDEEQARHSRQIHKRTLKDLGGAAQIVRDYLDAFMNRQPPKHQAISAAIFHYLVTPSGTKIAQSARDLAVYTNQDRKRIAKVLSTLAGPARLLRTVAAAMAGGEPRYEIYHDSLAPAVLHWRGRYYQQQREIRVRRWTIRLGIFLVALASLAIALSVASREIERSAAWQAADTTVTLAKATAQAGAETATAALDSETQATADFRVWQTAQAQATAAYNNLQAVQAQAMATPTRLVVTTPEPGGTEVPSFDPTATAAVETATAAAQSLQIAEQKVVAAAAEVKATATAAASATATARELRERLQTAGLTGRSVKVAILSTGIDATHPDLAGRIAEAKDFIGEGIEDGNGFGTCLASVAAGSGTASGGLYKGWATEADLYIAKVMDANGAATLSDVIDGLKWAVEQKVDIVLVPLGGPSGCDGSDEISQEADAAVEAGLVVIVPAGNSGPAPGTVGSPGCARLPITVGAAEVNTVADFSSRGPTLDGRTKPDLLFSGSGVGAQATGTEIGAVVASDYVEITGSGVSTAHAAGAIALLLQADPDLTPAEVIDLLMETATDLGFEANAQGAGLANIEGALARVRDRDEDGIPDVEDACPDEFGSSLAGGCPEPPTSTSTLTPTPSATPTSTPSPTWTPTVSFPITRTIVITGGVKVQMVYVPAGKFIMGSDEEDSDEDEQPVHTVYLDAFYIDRTEVTNEQFEQFVQDNPDYKTEPGKIWDADLDDFIESGDVDWRRPQDPDDDLSHKADHPVVQVSWEDAEAYCRWRGARLPTEAEWEKAAGWDHEQEWKLRWPWGNDPPTGKKLNYCDAQCEAYWKDTAIDDRRKTTAPVGSYPEGASPYGVLDMSGNVWEWVADYYDGDYYKVSPAENPLGPDANTGKRVLRGTSWFQGYGKEGRAASRFSAVPDTRHFDIGFRCSQSP
jgi:formylglycine-generating enzyme required for sulfatase activity